VRIELTSLGWSDEISQNEVFGAIDGIQGNNQLNRTR